MRSRPPQPGDVVEIMLPTERYAYGRVLRDASVAFYRETTDEPGQPPIGSRDFQFVVGVYDDVLKSSSVVGHDPSRDPEEDWPPPYCVRDVISGETKLYHKGVMRPARTEECEGLEPAAVWDLHHIIDRLMGMRDGQR
jgi:hypothetical protein